MNKSKCQYKPLPKKKFNPDKEFRCDKDTISFLTYTGQILVAASCTVFMSIIIFVTLF